MDHSNPNKIYSKNTIITMNTNDKHDTNWIQFATEPHATNTIFVEYYTFAHFGCAKEASSLTLPKGE